MFETCIFYKNYLINFSGCQNANDGCIVLDIEKNIITKVEIDDILNKRFHHACCFWKDNQFIIHGGWSNKRVHKLPTLAKSSSETLEASSDLFILSVHEKNGTLEFTIQEIVAANPLIRAHHSMVVHNDVISVFGGEAQGGDALNDLWTLNLKGSAQFWQRCQAFGDIPERSFGHTSLVYNQKMYVFGGCFREANGLRANTKIINNLMVLDFSQSTFFQF